MILKISYFILGCYIIVGCSYHQQKKNNIKKTALPKRFQKLSHLTFYTPKEEADTVQLKKIQTFGKFNSPKGGNPYISMAVDDSDHIFIPNFFNFYIYVYNSRDSLVAKLGGKGRGPGEFHEITSLQILGNRLYVYDGILKQYQIFSLHPTEYLTTVYTIPKNIHIFKNLRYLQYYPVNVLNDSTFLYRFIDRSSYFKKGRMHKGTKRVGNKINYYLMNLNRQIKPDTILHQNGKMIIITHEHGSNVTLHFSFTRRPLIAISKHHIYTARTGRFLIKVYTRQGKYERAFYYPYKKAPVTQRQLHMLSEGNGLIQQAKRKVIGKVELPKTWPALHSMKVDDQGRLWASTIVDNPQVYQWWVLNEQGKLLGRFRWPRAQPIKVINKGYVYAIKTDEGNGTYTLIKYKIVMK